MRRRTPSLATRTIVAALALGYTLNAHAVEPLHRIREMPANSRLMRLPSAASTQAAPLAQSGRVWLDALGRWLRPKRGAVAWSEGDALGAPQPQTWGTAQSLSGWRISDLQPGDRVTVQFQSDGCFAHLAGELVFDAAQKRWQLVDTLRLADPMGTSDEPRTCAALTQDPSRQAQFDELLAYWRHGAGEGCSSVLQATVTWTRGSQVLAVEQFRDAGCSLPNAALNLQSLFAMSCLG